MKRFAITIRDIERCITKLRSVQKNSPGQLRAKSRQETVEWLEAQPSNRPPRSYEGSRDVFLARDDVKKAE